MRGRECNRARRDLEKGILKEREHRGRKGWSGRVPLESFSLLAGLNRRL